MSTGNVRETLEPTGVVLRGSVETVRKMWSLF